MTTDRQLAANRQNAQHSTGPRTAEGKAASSRNNTRHGLRSTSPVLPRLESIEAWEQHRTSTIASLAPETAIEEALAERVALILWRLNRVVRYERDVTTQSQDRSATDLAGAADADRDLAAARGRYNEARRRARVLASLDTLPAQAHITGKDAASALNAIDERLPDEFQVQTFLVPEIVPDDLEYNLVPDWTVDRLLRFIAAIASANTRDSIELRAAALAEAQHQLNAERVTCRRLTRQVRDLRNQRILPEPQNIDRVVRYETHLMRQFTQTLGHFKQLQQQRETSRRRAAQEDYHRPTDFYDAHIYGDQPSDLPLSAPVGARFIAPAGGEVNHGEEASLAAPAGGEVNHGEGVSLAAPARGEVNHSNPIHSLPLLVEPIT